MPKSRGECLQEYQILFTSKIINGHKRTNNMIMCCFQYQTTCSILYNFIELYMYCWNGIQCVTWYLSHIFTGVKICVFIFCFLEVHEEDLYGKIIPLKYQSFAVFYIENFPFGNAELHCSISVSIWRENLNSGLYFKAYLLV